MERMDESSFLQGIIRKFDQSARRTPVQTRTRSEYKIWVEKARLQLYDLLGLNHFEDTELKAEKVSQSIDEEGRQEEKIKILVEEDTEVLVHIIYPSVMARLYIGDNDHKRPACMILLTQDEKKDEEIIRSLISRGYTVICPEFLWFNKVDCNNIVGHPITALGITYPGTIIWNLMKLIDYIYEQDIFDVTQLGCIGYREQGYLLLLASAVEIRIQTSIISNAVISFRDSLFQDDFRYWSDYIPHLWEYFDCGDLGAMIVPRELMLQVSTGESMYHLSGLETVYRQTRIMGKAYSLFDIPFRLRMDIRKGKVGFCSSILGNL